jgi:hypothetical protein
MRASPGDCAVRLQAAATTLKFEMDVITLNRSGSTMMAGG